MMWWFHDGGGWWMWLVMPLGMIVFWGLVVAAVVLVVRTAGAGASGHGPAGEGPERILSERFARGEIDADAYQRRLATLRSTHDHATA
ncbi:MAG TPA: SHOCT domain-containing protein [Acidimicrobiia bacterium]